MSRNPSYNIPGDDEEKGKCELCALNYDFESEVCQECFRETTNRNITFNQEEDIHWVPCPIKEDGLWVPLPRGFNLDTVPSEWFYDKTTSVRELMSTKLIEHPYNVIIIWSANRQRYYISLASDLPLSLRNNLIQTLLKIEDKKEVIEILTERIDALQDTLNVIAQKHADCIQQLNELQDTKEENDTLENKISSLSLELEYYRSDFERLTKLQKKTQDRVNILIEEVSELEKIRVDVIEEVENCSRELSRCKEENKNLIETCERENKYIINSLSRKLESKNEEIEDLEKYVESYERENLSSEKETEEKGSEYNTFLDLLGKQLEKRIVTEKASREETWRRLSDREKRSYNQSVAPWQPDIENYPLTGVRGGANPGWPYISVRHHYHDINFDVNILFMEINIRVLQITSTTNRDGNVKINPSYSKCASFMTNNPQKSEASLSGDRGNERRKMIGIFHMVMVKLIHQQIFTMRINNAITLFKQGNIAWANQNFEMAKKFVNEIEKLHTSFDDRKYSPSERDKDRASVRRGQHWSTGDKSLGHYDCSQKIMSAHATPNKPVINQPCFIPIWIDYAKKMLNKYISLAGDSLIHDEYDRLFKIYGNFHQQGGFNFKDLYEDLTPLRERIAKKQLAEQRAMI